MRCRTNTLIVITIAGMLFSFILSLFLTMLPRPLEFDSQRTARARNALWKRIDSNPDPNLERQRISGIYHAFGQDLIIIRPDVNENVIIHEHRAGWPFRVLIGRETVTSLPPPQVGPPYVERERQFGFELEPVRLLHAPRPLGGSPQTMGMKRITLNPAPVLLIPLAPILSGLVLNVLALFVMIVFLVLLRRITLGIWRKLRGRCPGVRLRFAWWWPFPLPRMRKIHCCGPFLEGHRLTATQPFCFTEAASAPIKIMKLSL